MCFNPYQYDQMTRDAAHRMRDVRLEAQERSWSLPPVFARLKALLAKPIAPKAPVIEPAE